MTKINIMNKINIKYSLRLFLYFLAPKTGTAVWVTSVGQLNVLLTFQKH